VLLREYLAHRAANVVFTAAAQSNMWLAIFFAIYEGVDLSYQLSNWLTLSRSDPLDAV